MLGGAANLFTNHCLHCEYAWQLGGYNNQYCLHLVNGVEPLPIHT